LENKNILNQPLKHIKMKNQIRNIILLFTLIFFTLSCDEKTAEITKLPSIYDIANSDKANFSVLLKAVEKTSSATDANSILNRIKNPGSFTLFAPTNTAFNTIGITEAAIDAMTSAQITDLRSILLNHILSVGTIASDLPADGYITTFATTARFPSTLNPAPSFNVNLYVNKSNGVVLNGVSKVTSADIRANNGVVHVINEVLTLPTVASFVASNQNLSKLFELIKADAGVLKSVSDASSTAPITVYAPINSAVEASITGFLSGKPASDITKVLQYHVETGNRRTVSAGTSFDSKDITVTSLLTQKFTIVSSKLQIKDQAMNISNIKTVNIQATNGVIHIIERVLQPAL
jgi:uncharacterized surface protein with fasciclin (FAS1) repeats